MNTDDAAAWLSSLWATSGDRDEATHQAWQQLENTDLIRRVLVHEYRCRRGCRLARVIRLGDVTLMRTEPYKFGRGLNLDRTVEAARANNTLDGDRHWPGHTFDVDRLAEWGRRAGMDTNCRHQTSTVFAVDVLEATRHVTPGHPGKPTLL